MSVITQSLAILRPLVGRLRRRPTTSVPVVLLGDGVVPAGGFPEGFLPWLLSQGCLTCDAPTAPFAAYVLSPHVGGGWRDVVPLCIACHALRQAGWRKLKTETEWDYQTLLMTAHDLAKQWASLNPDRLAEYETRRRTSLSKSRAGEGEPS